MKNRLANINFVTVILIMFLTSPMAGEEAVSLKFIHKEGQVLHADSLVDESVYINGYFSHRAEIDEFSVSRIREVDSDKSAVLDSGFRTVERIEGAPGLLEWISSETVRLKRDSLGFMSVPEDAGRPVLRNVPQFPDYTVNPGDTWILPGEEVHILRIGNVLYGPYRSDVQVLYTYAGNEIIDGDSYAKISLEYNLYLPVRQRGEPVRLISGQSYQEVFWDVEEGRPEWKNEEFEFLMMMNDGSSQEFIGTGRTTYRVTESLDRIETVESLLTELENVPGITVKPTEEGVLLSVWDTESILFEPESSVVSENQRFRLEELSQSLSSYEDHDILISGHTADYGTWDGRKALSRDRAETVADILFPQGRSGLGKLFLRGAGNTEPLGSDSANRRVEILILD